MGHLDESNQTSEDLESENATINNSNDQEIAHPAIDHDEPIHVGSNKNLISFASSSSSISSNFSVEDLQILDSDHDKSCSVSEPDDHLANQNEDLSEHPETSEHGIPSHVIASKMLTGPGNWSMASNESLFSIHMGGTSFCRLDSVSPLFDLPYDSGLVEGKILETDDEHNQGSSFVNETIYEEDEGNQFSVTSSSSSDSFVFPILSGEMENGDSPNPRGSQIGQGPMSPPKIEPAPEPGSKTTESGTEAEVKETTTFVTWTTWFPCFRNCACCS